MDDDTSEHSLEGRLRQLVDSRPPISLAEVSRRASGRRPSPKRGWLVAGVAGTAAVALVAVMAIRSGGDPSTVTAEPGGTQPTQPATTGADETYPKPAGEFLTSIVSLNGTQYDITLRTAKPLRQPFGSAFGGTVAEQVGMMAPSIFTSDDEPVWVFRGTDETLAKRVSCGTEVGCALTELESERMTHAGLTQRMWMAGSLDGYSYPLQLVTLTNSVWTIGVMTGDVSQAERVFAVLPFDSDQGVAATAEASNVIALGLGTATLSVDIGGDVVAVTVWRCDASDRDRGVDCPEGTTAHSVNGLDTHSDVSVISVDAPEATG
jgi:hypothetical protein